MTIKQETCPEHELTISEKGGLAFLRDTDLLIYAPGISTAGRAEIEMVRRNPKRSIIGTTINQDGWGIANQTVREMGVEDQIEVRLEDLREENNYPSSFFDFIYARLVLHYLSAQDLDFVLKDFYKILKQEGRLFIVVRSEKDIPEEAEISFDSHTKLTTIEHPGGSSEIRYFHTPENITKHLQEAGLVINQIDEYEEKLYIDFERKQESPYITDHLVEVCAHKE
jgi:cyclopropane fatty-acyl-phospholipid synthase-like methyltransferase